MLSLPATARTAAVEPGDEIRDGAWVAELDGDCLKGWPAGMQLIVRKEGPHPGVQWRFTDADGMRLTCLATNTKDMPIAVPELRHRPQARAEDRIRAARTTGLRSLLHDTAQNRIWLWNPAPTRRDSRATGRPITSPTSRNGPPVELTGRHEMPRLATIPVT